MQDFGCNTTYAVFVNVNDVAVFVAVTDDANDVAASRFLTATHTYNVIISAAAKDKMVNNKIPVCFIYIMQMANNMLNVTLFMANANQPTSQEKKIR